MGTKNKNLSTDAVPLQISTPSSSTTKVARVLYYGDLGLDKEIIIPSYDFGTMNLVQINEVQEALERRKKKRKPLRSRRQYKHW